jgi:hypothetical protein
LRPARAQPFPARVGTQIVDPERALAIPFRARTGNDVYNFGPSNYYQRPDDR